MNSPVIPLETTEVSVHLPRPMQLIGLGEPGTS